MSCHHVHEIEFAHVPGITDTLLLELLNLRFFYLSIYFGHVRSSVGGGGFSIPCQKYSLRINKMVM